MTHPAWDAPVVLLSGPAGSGKTTLLAQRVHRVRDDGRAVAWLTLEADGDGFTSLWTGVLHAVALAWNELGHREAADAIGTLRATAQAREGLGEAFSEMLEAVPIRTTLVLDGTHLLTPASGVDAIVQLARSNPGHFDLVLAGRWHPLVNVAQLLLDGTAAELQGRDLLFGVDDAAELFKGHGVVLDDVQLSTTVELTEGWAAGLQLAAITMSRLADPAHHGDFLDSFTGDARPVAEFLVSEVLEGLEPEVRDLMTATALPAQISVDLAVELTGRANAGAVLDRLAEANALVSRIDGPEPAYRYHSLLRGYLLALGSRRDRPGQVRRHRRVADWAERHGLVEEAIRHRLAAEDWAGLAATLDAHGVDLVLRGQGDAVRQALAAMPAARRTEPDLLLVAAMHAAMEGRAEDLAGDLALLGTHDQLDSDPVAGALLWVARTTDALLRGDLEVCQRLAAVNAPLTPEAGPSVHALVQAAQGKLSAYCNDYAGAEPSLAEAWRIAFSEDYDLLALECLSHLVVVSAGRGRYAELRERATEAMRFARARGWTTSPLMAGTYGVGAWGAWIALDEPLVQELNHLAGRIEGAVQPHAVLGRELHAAYQEFAGFPDFSLVRKRTQRAWERLDPALMAPQAYAVYAVFELGLALEVRQRAWVHEILERSALVLGPDDQAVLHAAVDLASGRPSTALQLPVTGGSIPPMTDYVSLWGRLVRAAALTQRGNQVLAHEAVQDALDVAEPLDARRPFVDAPPAARAFLLQYAGRLRVSSAFLQPILAHLQQPAGRSATPFTQRELDVLAELRSRLTVSEIAANLGISENTVRTHLKSIYRKLSVTQRREAIAEAEHLGLLQR